MSNLSMIARKGSLWLGRALGAEYIGLEVEKALVRMTGRTEKGDCAVGTGVHVGVQEAVTRPGPRTRNLLLACEPVNFVAEVNV